ncbi:MAG: glycosyltransferase family 2 protein, partial [Acetobacteraceae bacterium]
RHQSLSRLIACLERQGFRDFEAIVVDQSKERWPDAEASFGFPLFYLHAEVRGAVAARNRGASLARGEIIAFTDDDCEPAPGWLAAGADAFSRPGIVGVEGLVTSDHVGEAGWRPVTNDGLEGLSFITANLFVKADDFYALGGFDLGFEDPHFREDTDLGWRLEERGEVPFCREAWVHHPAQPRSQERESLEARSRYFEKDALLLAKHPRRYVDLFLLEAQWLHNPDFFYYLKRGAERYGVPLPGPVRKAMAEWAQSATRP